MKALKLVAVMAAIAMLSEISIAEQYVENSVLCTVRTSSRFAQDGGRSTLAKWIRVKKDEGGLFGFQVFAGERANGLSIASSTKEAKLLLSGKGLKQRVSQDSGNNIFANNEYEIEIGYKNDAFDVVLSLKDMITNKKILEALNCRQ